MSQDRRAFRSEKLPCPGNGKTALRWAPTAVVIALALTVYLRTLAPTITLRNDGADSGDLVTAAINLGVPHPTGYPLYTLLAHAFTRLPGPEPARKINWLSALAAAFSVGIVFHVAHRSVARQGDSPLLALASAWAAAGLFGFGQLLWSQATIAEVYSLHALWVALLLLAAACAPTHVRPYALAFLFGMGLSNHVTIALALPALWPYASTIRRWLTSRRLLGIGACLLPGLATYLYIPLRAAGNPVPNWGYADNLPGLWWLISGAAYRHYILPLTASEWLRRLGAWVGIWVRDLSPVGLALAMLGLWEGWGTRRRSMMAQATYVAVLSLYSMAYSTSDSYLYLIPAAMILALWTAEGAAAILRDLQNALTSLHHRRLVNAGATLILVALPFVAIASRLPAMDLHTDRGAYEFAHNVLVAAAPRGVVVSEGDAQTFPLWYLRYGLQQRPDVTIVDRHLLAFGWYRRAVAAREPELAALAHASDAWSAITILVQHIGQPRPVHLTFSDEAVLKLATWEYEPPLYTLHRN